MKIKKQRMDHSGGSPRLKMNESPRKKMCSKTREQPIQTGIQETSTRKIRARKKPSSRSRIDLLDSLGKA